MTPDDLAQEHISQTPHDPARLPVVGCPLCVEWRTRYRCHGLGSSGTPTPPKDDVH